MSDQPAFPHSFVHPQTGGLVVNLGMSLRDYFAAHALSGQCAFEGMSGCEPEHIVGMSYQLADAMLKARAA